MQRIRTVDKFADGLLVGITICNERLDNLQHLHGGLGHLDEDTIVNLEKSEELQGFAFLGINLVDTLDTNNEYKLGFFRDVEAVALLRLARQPDLLLLGVSIFLHILLGPGEDSLSLLLALLCSPVSPMTFSMKAQ